MNAQLPKKGQDYLKEATEQIGPCLTLSIECDGGGRNSQIHRDRLRRSVNRLKKRSQDSTANRAMFSKLQSLIDNREMWAGDYQGVCIHISEQVTRFLKLPYPPVEKARIEDEFCLRPAADAIAALSDWLALDVSLKSPRLYHYDGENVRRMDEVELPSSVHSFSEAGALDSGQNAHVRRSQGRGSPRLVSQGVNDAKNPRELNETIFMREIAHALQALPQAKELPLVVIGDKRVVSGFLNTYRHRGGEVVTVSDAQAHPSSLEVAELCRQIAWEEQQQQKSQVLETIEEMRSRDGVFSNNVREVYEAARQGRVSAAVLACDDDIWCRIGGDDLPKSAKPEDEDAFEALDRIYLETLLKDGNAIVLPESEIPGGKSVAAVFKW
ncbi:hypothetical protein QEH56_07290 [Pelagicoccus enzymogenes]|uniref:baeRF3 domain-containing protein n=1 Tax=Pelagicoccus enzymogenes TaxID=2773457 RepID=UPI00280C4BE1|nr:hypothetical protein [Pelagicoccus enzymogenes]MDQ8197945.1 hypothetical protein [Pelagicoccus enzymogenes]